MRAYSDNPSLASVSGINVDRVIITTWTISGAFGALAGIFKVPSKANLQVEWDWIYFFRF